MTPAELPKVYELEDPGAPTNPSGPLVNGTTWGKALISTLPPVVFIAHLATGGNIALSLLLMALFMVISGFTKDSEK